MTLSFFAPVDEGQATQGRPVEVLPGLRLCQVDGKAPRH